jgi:rhodanese-related sulfurtransferase
MIRIERGIAELVAFADEKVSAMAPEQVEMYLATAPRGVLLIDIRDIREVKREGKILGSFHIPRGMLEFWIDPASPYYKSQFENAEELILYCNKGARSALATQTLMEMGVTKIAHMSGGFTRWVEEGRKVIDT